MWKNRPAARAILASFLAGQLMAADHTGLVRFGGLPLPGATVTATQGVMKYTTVTGPDGTYKFADLADGTWTVEASMLLFNAQKKEIMPPGTAEWDLDLLPADQISKLVVAPPPAPPPIQLSAGNAKPVPTAKPGAAQTNTRSAFQRTQLNAAPGAAAPPNDNANNNNDPNARQDPAELRNRAADGLMVNGSVNNGAASPFAQIQAFGNNRRGLRSLYNGSIGIIENNSALNARNYSLTGQDTPKPAWNQFQGVAAFGGPLRIPKLLVRGGPQFTVNYQWTRNTNATTQTGLMPTIDQRNGILADRTIPVSQISPQAKALLAFYPLPNFTGNTRYNYQVPIVNGNHQDDLQVRAQRGIGRRDQVSGQTAYQRTRTDTTNLFGFLDTGRVMGLNTQLSWRHSFNPRFFGNLNYQYSRQTTRTNPFFSNSYNVAAAAGISGTNQTPLYWGPPSLSFASGISVLNDQQAAFNRNQTSGVTYDLFYARGRHNWTAGGGFRRQQFNVLAQQDPRGTFTFTGLSPGTSGSDFANFLLGTPDVSSIAFGNADKYLRASNGEAWINDDWRLNPGLTLNLGVRWEYWGPVAERQGRLVNLNLAPGFTAATPVVSGSPLQADRNNLAPRLSFSWRPLAASSMVVRGGYGVYYDTSVYQPIASQMAQQAPLSKSLRISNTLENPITLANGFSSPGTTTTTTTFAVDPGFRLGYSQNWQLSLQRDLPYALQMTATYSGVKGTRAPQQILPNSNPAGAAVPCPTCPTGFTYLQSNGNSIRNAGQIQIRRRLRSGLTAQGQYTYSKSYDNAILGGRGAANPSGYIAQNWQDLHAEWGRSVFDQRHNVTGMVQYTSNMGLRGSLANNWKGKVLRDWTFGATVNAGTGLPLNPVYLVAAKGTGVTGTVRPDLTGADIYNAPAGLHINPAAFKAPATGQWGNAPRNSISGPHQFTLNASMNRSFQMRDRITIDFRVDSTNPINNVTYSSWVSTVNSTQFGLPTVGNPMRSFQTSVRARF